MLHHLGGFLYKPSPFAGRFGADFPEAVVLVPDTPVFYPVRPGTAVFDAPFGVFPFGFQVAVFHPVAHFFRGSRSGIGADIRLTANFPAHFDVFIRAEGVGILHAPCLVKEGLTFFPDSVLPVVGGYKTAARPAQNRHLYLPHG